MSFSEIGKRILSVRREKAMTLQEIADAVGLSKSTIQRYESGSIETILPPVLKDIARCLDVTPEWLLGISETKHVDPMANLKMYPVGELTRIPVIGIVRAGEGGIAYEQLIGIELIEKADVADGEYFFLKVEGDSMSPTIDEGDLVLVRKQDVVESGDLAIVIVNDEEGRVKKIKKIPNGYLLMSFNDKYEPVVIVGESLESFYIVGKVKQSRKKF